ncbi:MAG TPA: serine/threonine-protein kinase [Gemmataceae bacterium]|nr:serine/threonine-protein kinase [Gemmataceae bacterium]
MPLPQLPGYRLLRYLGGGPTFQVWEGRPADDTVPLALKFPRPDPTDEEIARTLLGREALAGLLVRHRRLVRVVREHLDESPPFIVLQYVAGENLRDRLTRLGRLDARSAVWAVRQAAEGLAALHRAGFAHGDVKPGNVLVDSAGSARLIDLGFAHRPGENVDLVKVGFMMGTANYIAPELCRRPQLDTPAADVFGLGVTLFECLSGQLPYPAATAEEALKKRRKARPRDLADVPGAVDAIPAAARERVLEAVRAMLAIDPHDRPPAVRVIRQLAQIEIELIRLAG